MGSHQKKFYMIRLKGGKWEPVRKYTKLAKAMSVAFEMTITHGKPATVLQTICTVTLVDGKAKWVDAIPEPAPDSTQASPTGETRPAATNS